MNELGDREQFVREVTQLHRPLYTYIYSLVGSIEAADDILQETNLQLWTKFERNEPIRNFRALAYELARFQVLTWRKKQQRDKLRFGDQTFDKLASEAAPGSDRQEEWRQAVRHCMGLLPEQSRIVLEQRYADGGSVRAIATATGRTDAAVSQSLYRIRNVLADCIRRFIEAEDRA